MFNKKCRGNIDYTIVNVWDVTKGVARENLRGAEILEFENKGGVLQGVKGLENFFLF